MSPTTTGLRVNYLSLGTQSIHMAHQHECAMTELSAKQSPSILPSVSSVARHMAGSPGGTLSFLLKHTTSGQKNRCCRSLSVHFYPCDIYQPGRVSRIDSATAQGSSSGALSVQLPAVEAHSIPLMSTGLRHNPQHLTRAGCQRRYVGQPLSCHL